MDGRATLELERTQAELSSRLSFREAARVLDIFLPTASAHNPRTLSNRLAKVADQIEKWDVASPCRISRAGKSAVSVFIDGAYIRAVPGYQSRHFEIAMGRVVFQGQAPRQFAGAPHIATCKHDIVRAAMRAQGRLPGRDVTVFSDGEVGLQSIVLSATHQPVTHITIGGRRYWLWRAVDQDGYVLDEILQTNPPQQKGRDAASDPVDEKAGMPAEAHRH